MIRRHLARWLPALLIALFLTAVPAGAQTSIPNGVFVKNSQGLLWLVLDGQRVKIPVWPASDDEIAALPVPDRWAVMNDAGAIVAGDAPAWLGSASAPPPALASVQAPPPILPTPTPIPNSATYGGLTAVALSAARGSNVANSFEIVKRGMEFLAIEMRLDNPTSAQIPYNSAEFSLATADGARWDIAASRDPVLGSGQVLPRSSVRGWIVFQIPTGAVASQLLWGAHYDTTLVITLLN